MPSATGRRPGASSTASIGSTPSCWCWSRASRRWCCPTAAPASRPRCAPQQHYLFYTMFLLCLAGLLGITITGDAFNIFVFLEISSLSTYVLIALGRDRRALGGVVPVPDHGHDRRHLHRDRHRPALSDDRHAEPGRHGPAHRQPCRARGRCWRRSPSSPWASSLKLALFPLHQWLPNAYTYAPSAVTALLAGHGHQGRGLRAAALLLLGVRRVGGVRAAADARGDAAARRWPACSWPRRSRSSRPTSSACSPTRASARSATSSSGLSFDSASGLTATIVHLFNHGVTKGAIFLLLGGVALVMGGTSLARIQGLGTAHAADRASASCCAGCR